MHLVIYTDGGARGNPGPAGIGVVIYREARGQGLGVSKLELVEKFGKYIGKATNNQAEYQALLSALKRARELGAEELEVRMDSELAVRQLNREYKVRDKELAPLFVKVWNETIHFKAVRFYHIPRERNREADKMVNEAIDNTLRGKR
jgi:ribonuclease HI